MNRQILFKAKRKDNGEWVEGYYVYCRKRRYILPILNKEIGFDERENEWIEIDPAPSASTQDLLTRTVIRFGRMISAIEKKNILKS